MYKRSVSERFNDKAIKTASGCWGWSGAFSKKTGYTAIRAFGKQTSGHRVSYEINVGPIPDGMYVLHKCDNRRCTNPEHLFVGSLKDNTQDALSKGRICFGSNHPTSKLTEKQVFEIRRLASLGMSQRRLAAMHGVSKTAVAFVIHRVWWKQAA